MPQAHTKISSWGTNCSNCKAADTNWWQCFWWLISLQFCPTLFFFFFCRCCVLNVKTWLECTWFNCLLSSLWTQFLCCLGDYKSKICILNESSYILHEEGLPQVIYKTCATGKSMAWWYCFLFLYLILIWSFSEELFSFWG